MHLKRNTASMQFMRKINDKNYSHKKIKTKIKSK